VMADGVVETETVLTAETVLHVPTIV
jgi:hypothetical protein